MQSELSENGVYRLHHDWGLNVVFCREAWAEIEGGLRGVQDFLRRGVLPFASYQFLHGDVLHLLGNVLLFWVLGTRLEARFGRLRFLILFFAIGAAAGATEVWLADGDPEPAVGPSGTLAGLALGYLQFHPKARIRLMVPLLVWPIFVEVAALFVVAFWVMVQFRPVMRLLSLGPGTPVDWTSIAGGSVAGLVFVPLIGLTCRGRSPKRKQPGRRPAQTP